MHGFWALALRTVIGIPCKKQTRSWSNWEGLSSRLAVGFNICGIMSAILKPVTGIARYAAALVLCERRKFERAGIGSPLFVFAFVRVTIAGHPKDVLHPKTWKSILEQAGLRGEIDGGSIPPFSFGHFVKLTLHKSTTTCSIIGEETIGGNRDFKEEGEDEELQTGNH